ncbi:hypothetical protein HYY73_01385 [Candidatus Woesearchaeota archaeon]|nr:hypothetical protein [Candidatus Woesearchaeota archaeon]
MDEQQNFGKGEKVYISLEMGDLTRNLLIVIASFLATAIISVLIKHLLKSNIVMMILLVAAAIVSMFFAMRIAKLYVKGYVERYGGLVIPPAMAAIFVVSSLKPVVFAVLFLLHSAACVFLRQLKNTARLGIELTMLITILGSFVYGAKIGALLGATAMLMDYAMSARFSYFSPVTTGTYILIGLFAGNFSSFGITAVGIAAAVVYNLATSFIIVAFMGGHSEKCFRFGLSNIALNFVLFTTAAPWLLSILK